MTLAVLAALVTAGAASVGASSSRRDAPRIKGATDSTSTNWSGYAATSPTPFTDVKGSWTQPGATCSSTTASTAQGPGNGNGNGHGNPHGGGGGSGKAQSSYASFWVGLDGYSSNTVEQTGTDADCNGTTPVYYGWYEFYPAFPVNFPDPVQPGDSMSAEVSASPSTVTITLRDLSQHWTKQASQPSTGYALTSAEWIAEAPSSGKVLPLADFTTVTFTGATATGAGTTGPISSFSYDPITMTTSGGQTKAAPSNLTGNGDSFSVSWYHS